MPISKVLRYGLCVTRESHGFTCYSHPNHICLYCSATRHHCPLAGTDCWWLVRLHDLVLCVSSDLRDNAEERCRSAHGQFVLLGQHHRRSVSLRFILRTSMHCNRSSVGACAPQGNFSGLNLFLQG